MNHLLIITTLILLAACSNSSSVEQKAPSPSNEPTTIVTEDYELIMPKKQEGLLILFPCYPCNAENTRTEFNIVDTAIDKDIAVLLMNFNQHLWLSASEKTELEGILVDAVREHNISTDNTYIGGFSSGGNVSFLLADHLRSSGSAIQPKGLFIADSPLDLLALYENAKRTIEKDFSAVAMQEARWIVETSERDFGLGDTAIAHYKKKSPYLSKTSFTENVSHLSGVKIRLYSEPDTQWWKENRRAEYKEMNAFYIEQLANELSELYGEDRVEYIRTKNRGYRANGDRHPHSWAIIDEVDLVSWMGSE